jgi:hypothetical protein
MWKEADKTYEIPLWEVNHSKERLAIEQKSDWIAFRLGYQMEATSVDPSKTAYKHFSDEQYPDGNVTEMDFVSDSRVSLMMDFNKSPQTAALGQRMGNTYIVFDEVVSDNALTPEQGNNVANRLSKWGISHVYLYGDNTSNQKAGKYGRTGRNDWEYIKEELQKKGITFTSRLKKQNPKRKVRVDKVNTIIYNIGTKERRLLIHNRCEWAINDYLRAETNDEGIKIDTGKIGHISDAIDYWIYECEIGGGAPTFIM